MKKYILLFLVMAGVIGANEIKDRTEEIIKITFGDNISTSVEEYFIPLNFKNEIETSCRQKFFKESVYLWRIYKGNELLGYAILDNVYGKSLPITFLVLFNTHGEIARCSIIKYREPYGGAVQNEVWLNQFIGKNYESKFGIGEDVDAISGATISAGSVTTGINKLTLLLKKITG